jgi:hypothetical protein
LGAEVEKLTIIASAEDLVLMQSVEDDIIWVTKAKVVEYTQGEFSVMVSC